MSASTTTKIGVKGSTVWADTCSPLLDYSLGAVRGASSETIQKILDVTDPELAFVAAFHVRNIRGGKGERDIFKKTMQVLYTRYPDLTLDLLDLVPHYGCWNDLFDLAKEFPPFRARILKFAAITLLTDATADKDLSLCAKWAPRERKGAHVDSYLLKDLAKILFPDIQKHETRMAEYRRLVACLNRRLKTVETFMSGGKWAEIVPSSVPGRAGSLYSRALLNLKSTYQGGLVRLNHEESRALRKPADADRMACRKHFVEYFASASASASASSSASSDIKGADTLYPHEIVRKALKCNMSPAEADQIVAIWNAMVAKVKAAGTYLEDCEVMCDFSGSMRHGHHDGIPFFVSLALGVLISEVTGKNRILTFDSEPRWHKFPEGNLLVKLGSISEYLGQGTSTDFQKAYNLIVEDKQAPSFVLVLTDMNFDQARGSETPGQTHAEMAKAMFQRIGEEAPVLGIWNLAANPTDIQATANEEGVVLLSGWSPTQFTVLQQEGLRSVTPMELLRKELEAPQYDRVRDRMKALLDYSI